MKKSRSSGYDWAIVGLRVGFRSWDDIWTPNPTYRKHYGIIEDIDGGNIYVRENKTGYLTLKYIGEIWPSDRRGKKIKKEWEKQMEDFKLGWKKFLKNKYGECNNNNTG